LLYAPVLTGRRQNGVRGTLTPRGSGAGRRGGAAGVRDPFPANVGTRDGGKESRQTIFAPRSWSPDPRGPGAAARATPAALSSVRLKRARRDDERAGS